MLLDLCRQNEVSQRGEMTSKRKDIVERGKGPEQIRTIDKGIKNAWKWDWLEKDVDGVSLAEIIRKLDRAGIAFLHGVQ